MRKSLLLLSLLGAFIHASAEDKIKVKVVSSDTNSPIALADISVEYPDTIVNYKSNKRGKLSFIPASFPLTITAQAEGMESVTFGYFSMPSKMLKIEMPADPSAIRVEGSRRVDWASNTPPRLRSTYIVRHPAKK